MDRHRRRAHLFDVGELAAANAGMLGDHAQELGVERGYASLLGRAAQLTRRTQESRTKRLGEGDEILIQFLERHGKST